MRRTRSSYARKKPQEEALDWIGMDKDPPGFRVKQFQNKGRGIITTISRSKGDFLLHYCGEQISGEEGEVREERGSSGFRFFYSWKGKELCVDATEESNRLGRLVNHGTKKEINSVMRSAERHLVLYALRDIDEGEEILYNYGIKNLPWEKAKETTIICKCSVDTVQLDRTTPADPLDSRNLNKCSVDTVQLYSTTPVDPLDSRNINECSVDTVQLDSATPADPLDSRNLKCSVDTVQLYSATPADPLDSRNINECSVDTVQLDSTTPADPLDSLNINECSVDTVQLGSSTLADPLDSHNIKECSVDTVHLDRNTPADPLDSRNINECSVDTVQLDSTTPADPLDSPNISECSMDTDSATPADPLDSRNLNKYSVDTVQLYSATPADPLDSHNINECSVDTVQLGSSTLADPLDSHNINKCSVDTVHLDRNSPADPLDSHNINECSVDTVQLDSTTLADPLDSRNINECSVDTVQLDSATPADPLDSPNISECSMDTDSATPADPLDSRNLNKYSVDTVQLYSATPADPLDSHNINECSVDTVQLYRATPADPLDSPNINECSMDTDSATPADPLDSLNINKCSDDTAPFDNVASAIKETDAAYKVIIEDTEEKSKIAVVEPRIMQFVKTTEEDEDSEDIDEFDDDGDADFEYCSASSESDSYESDISDGELSDIVPYQKKRPVLESSKKDIRESKSQSVAPSQEHTSVSSSMAFVNKGEASSHIKLHTEEGGFGRVDTASVEQRDRASVSSAGSSAAEGSFDLKFYFKNISVQVYESKGGKRNYAKSDFCLFCKKEIESKIRNHLFAMHSDQPLVKEAMTLPLKSLERRKALTKLQNEGNYVHNIEVLKKGSGRLVVSRRPKTETDASKYIPCEYCLAFVNENLLWQHARSCLFRPCEIESEKNYLRNGKLLIQKFITHSVKEMDDLNNELDKLLSKMKETARNPGVKNICSEDQLIREFGLSLLERLGLPEEQRTKDHDNIRTKLRSVGRLLQTLNEGQMTDQSLSFFIHPRQFQKVVKAVKELSRQVDSPKLALNLGNYIKQISILKGSLAVDEEDPRKRQEAIDFRDHFNAHWSSRVASVANRTMKLRALNKKQDIPLTADLIRLRNYTKDAISKCFDHHKMTYKEYVRFAWLLIARIAMFTKRRISEVDELTVDDFKNRIHGEDTDGNSEIIESLDISEKLLYKRIDLIEVRGKSTRALRKVFVLLTEDMVRAINHLLSIRIYAGVKPDNKFIFGRSNSSKLDGCTALREVTESCEGLVRPELIRTRLLRKYMATTCQIMDMNPEELKMLADHMGHSLHIHTDVYRLQSSVLERTKVARLLLAVEDGQVGRYRGHSLDALAVDDLPKPHEDDESIEDLEEENEEEPMLENDMVDVPIQENEDIEEQEEPVKPQTQGIKRKRWSVEEVSALRQAFGQKIAAKQNVSTDEIREAKRRFRVLNERTEAMLRTKINNIRLGKEKV